MKIQIYMKNEPLEDCDVLIAKESAAITVPIGQLMKLAEKPPKVLGIKDSENLMMKAAILVSQSISEGMSNTTPTTVQVACPDKQVLDAICSLDYRSSVTGPVRCVPAAAAKTASKPAQKPKVNNLAKPKAANQPAQAAKKPENGSDASGKTEKPDKKPDIPVGKPDIQAEPAEAKPAADETSDPDGFVDGEEVDLSGADDPEPAKERPFDTNAMKAMQMLKDAGIHPDQIPGCIDAVREAIDPVVTLPMQVKLKLAKDGALDAMDPDETTKLLAPIFSDVKGLIAKADKASK